MHAQYVFVLVSHVARDTACCVLDEFTHGAPHLHMMRHHVQVACVLFPSGLTHFQVHSVKMKRHFVISGCATAAMAFRGGR